MSQDKQVRDPKNRKNVPKKSNPNPNRNRYLFKIGILLGAGALTGLGELIGEHFADIGAVVAHNPVSSGGIGGFALAGVAATWLASRFGR